MIRALVVDDNVDLATNVGELLQTLGLEVEVAHDAPSAIDSVARRPADLALVDVRLPDGVSGVDLVPRLRELSPGIEIVLVTGNATVDSAIAAVRHGVFAYVQKPFDSADLLALVRRVLTLTESRRERTRLAADLERSEAMYRSLVETVDAAILLLDRDGVVRFANASARATLIPESGGALEGLDFVASLVADVDRARVRKALAEGSATRAQTSVEASSRGGRGARMLRWSFIPNPSSDSGQRLAVGLDLTEIRELQRRSAEAEALGAIGTLTTGLAHEIRNPLNAATLQLELLSRAAKKVSDGAVREGMEKRVHIVRDELARLERMLAEFLSLARPRALELSRIDVAALLDEVVELELPVAEAQGVRLTHQVASGFAAVRVDVARIKQVLINLVGNSLDALRAVGAGTISLHARVVDGGFLELRVEDDGSGFEPTAADVFEPFVTTKEGGTGLGLSIVRTIVERHGGSVTLESRLPRGTIARFTVPSGE